MSSGSLHIANDLRLASSDLEAAGALTRINNRNDAYHVQQAVEKILLALLTAEGIHVERRDGHRLDVLRDKLPEENSFKRRFDGLTYLTAYATTYRYPKDAGRIPDSPAAQEMMDAVEKIGRILDDVARYFGVDLSASDRIPARTNAPPRSQLP